VSRDSTVGIVTVYELNDQGSISGRFRPALGPTQPSIQSVPGHLSPGLKRQGREVDHSLLPSAEVKNDGARPPLSTRFHCVVLN
jgi:hypothetical protein